MKINKPLQYFLLVLSIVGLVAFVANYTVEFFFPKSILVEDLKVGQVWVKTYYDKDPFKQTVHHFERIIDLKDGYVLYVEDGIDTLSDSEYWFVVNAELKK